MSKIYMYVKGNLCRIISFSAVKRSKKIKSMQWLHENVSKMNAHLNGRNGTETALCRHCCIEHCCVFASVSLSGEWHRGARPLCGGQFLLVFRCFLSNCRFAMFHYEVQNHWHCVFLEYKLTKLERGSNKLVTKRFCSKLSSVKCFTQMHECFEGMKHSLFTFVSHFWVLGEVLTLDFEWFSSEGQIFRIS